MNSNVHEHVDCCQSMKFGAQEINDFTVITFSERNLAEVVDCHHLGVHIHLRVFYAAAVTDPRIIDENVHTAKNSSCLLTFDIH